MVLSMDNLSTTMCELSKARRRGDHRAVVAIACQTLEVNADWTAVALEAVRAERRAGRLRAVREWLGRAEQSNPDDSEARLIQLEFAWLGILENMAFKEAIDCADQVFLNCDERSNCVSPELQWLATRVLLSASSYRILPAWRVAIVRRTLRAQQNALAATGHIELSHEVARERAAVVGSRHRMFVWAAVARLGVREDMPATVGMAFLKQAVAARETDVDKCRVLELIDKAERAYEEANHQPGLLEVESERALLAIDRDGASLERLESVIDRFINIGEPAMAVLYLADLGIRAHERCDRALSIRVAEAHRLLTQEHGLLLLMVANSLSDVQLALQRGDDSLARDLCDEALALDLPPSLRADFLAVRGSAYSSAGLRGEAITDRRQAIDLFESIGAEDNASLIVETLVSDIASTRRKKEIDEADELLLEWERRDLVRGDPVSAYQRNFQRADLRVLQIMGARKTGELCPEEEHALISDGLKLLDRVACELYAHTPLKLTQRTHARLLAENNQHRAGLLSLRGDVSNMQQILELAAEDYMRASLPLQATNCRYMLGCIALNLANGDGDIEDLLTHASTAQTQLRAALAYYDDVAGMRVIAAETRRLLAMLYLNLHHRMLPEVADDLLTDAETYLETAANDLEAVRRDYTASTRLEGLDAKSGRVEEAALDDAQAFRLHFNVKPNASQAWRWVSRSKARGLVDLLGPSVEVPAKLTTLAADEPELARLIDEERSLSIRLASCPAQQRRAIAADIAAVRSIMSSRPELQEYLLRRTGGAPLPGDIERIGERAPNDVALVDWAVVGDDLHLLIARPGEQARSIKLKSKLSTTHELVYHSLSTSGDVRRALTSGARQLEKLSELVSPLAELTRPGEHLVLCPTGILHKIPFQLLKVDGVPLIERNPLARTPSLGLLRIACERSSAGDKENVEIFGDPSSDRLDARRSAEQVAAALKLSPRLGVEASLEAFECALAEASLLLYQGHARHLVGDALSSHFLLANDERLDVRRILELSNVACRTMIIGACEGGRSDFRTGDEPLGLLAALLIVGVASVTAADWAVHAGSAREIIVPYTAQLLRGHSPIESLREAALALREDQRYRAPYHWGAFSVHGDPWRPVH